MSSADATRRVVVYDGHCHLCSGWVQFLHTHPSDPPFELIAMQSEAGRALLTSFGIDADDPATFLVLDQGRARTESDAAIHVICAVGGLWRLAAIARILPRPIRDALYRTLARNRYRWFGKRDTCYLPPS
jgi:predicted DCC family thiol-disulfide oxidoreductase YuxK